MAEQVVTELVIDAKTDGADEYSRKMDQAGRSSQGFYEQQQSLALSIAGVGTAIIGAIAAGNQFLDYIAKANKDLADMARNARLAGVSVADFQALKFAGNITGMSDTQFNDGLQKSAALLADAARNSNTLSKTFALNGLSIKDTNGRLISQNDLIEKSGKLMLGLVNEQDKIKLASQLGFTKEWIPLLERAGGNFSAIGDEARKAGVIISDETIGKATQFDAEWRRSTVTFEANMKAALVGLLPFVNDLITKATEFVGTIDRQKVEKFANDNLKQLVSPLGDQAIPNDLALKIEVTPETTKAIDDIMSAGTLWGSIAAAFKALNRVDIYNGPFKVTQLDPDQFKPHPNAGPEPGMYGSEYDMTTPAALKAMGDRVAALKAQREATTLLLQEEQKRKSTLDTEEDRLTRHIAVIKADTAAVGLSEAARAGLRAEATLYAAAERAGFKYLDQFAERFKKIRDEVEDTTAALAKARLNLDIKREGELAFLSPQEVQIAERLRGIYPEISAALQSAEAETVRLNAPMSSLRKQPEPAKQGDDRDSDLRNQAA